MQAEVWPPGSKPHLHVLIEIDTPATSARPQLRVRLSVAIVLPWPAFTRLGHSLCTKY